LWLERGAAAGFFSSIFPLNIRIGGCSPEETLVPLFLIERNFAEIVETDPETMATVKQVNDEIGIQWLFSFLSADKRKTYCLYEAPNAEMIRAAARRLGVPADTIVEVGEIGPYASAIAPLREQVAESVRPLP
jgi:Nickel responsive protein SCO4226-like